MSLKRGIFFTFLTQAPTLLLYFGASTLMTRMLGEVGRGEYALVTNQVALLAMLMSLNMGFGITFFTAKASNDPRNIIGTTASLLLFNALVVPLILFGVARTSGLAQVLMPSDRMHWAYWAFVYLSVMVSLINTSIGAVMLGLKKFRIINWMSLLNAALSATGLLVVFLLRDRLEPQEVLPAVLIASGTAMGLQTLTWCALYILQVKITPVPIWSWAVVRPILAFSLVGHLSNLINLINYRFDVWVVDQYQGAAQLGLYAVAVGIGQLLFNVPEPFSRVVQPYLFGQVKDEMLSRFKAVARLNFTVLVVLAISLGALAQWVIPFLFGDEFLPSVAPLRLLLPGIVFSGTAKLLAQVVVQGSYQRFNLYSTAMAAVATIALDFLLIPLWGIEGAAVASSVSYLIVLVILLLTIRFKLKIPVHDIFLLHPSDIAQFRGLNPWTSAR